MKYQDNLTGAIEYISRYGWHQGDYYTYRATEAERKGLGPDDHPPACVLGALSATNGGDFTATWEAVHALNKVIFGSPVENGMLAGWNDNPARTAEDVILALKRATAVRLTTNSSR
ncbi:hypothetical protein C6N75_09800 [Streptomyces solincola]|uniref:Uncharacterized protein n=1 Tax=Streptomyces solincola TaxID=2100817 RepID=A0A2S9PY73_9ACTN|nr:hypothetical protein [Streptomyces solincola]PRH79368.1 hypothetical protein C6N75_09800 [Streptomyces solincola]